MAHCDITTGRELPCKDGIGGISGLFIINKSDPNFGPVYDSVDTGVITDLGAVTAYYYEIKSASNLIQTMTSTQANGTTFVAQAVTAILQRMDYKTNQELLLLAYGQPKIIVQFKTGQSFVCGVEFGASLDTAVADSGTALGDLNGYTLTINAEERAYAPSMYDAVQFDPVTYTGDNSKSGPFENMVTQPTAIIIGSEVEIPPQIPAPSGLTISNITATGFDVDWTENGSATNWEIATPAQGVAPSVWTSVASVKPYTESSLTTATKYDVYIRAVEGGATSSPSDPVGVETA
jgi:hypothetical protein